MKTDIWARIACVLFVLCCGYAAYEIITSDVDTTSKLYSATTFIVLGGGVALVVLLCKDIWEE